MEFVPDPGPSLPLFTILVAAHILALIGCLAGLDSRIDGDPSGSILLSSWMPAALLLGCVAGLLEILGQQSWFLLSRESLLGFSPMALWLLCGAHLWVVIWMIPGMPFFLRVLPYLGLFVAAFLLRS